MTKFLVTGGHGFIGHNVVARLQARGDEVVVVDNHTHYNTTPQTELNYLLTERLKKLSNHTHYNYDIVKSDVINAVIANEKPDVIIHLASCPRQKVASADPVRAAEVMTKGLINLLESAKKHNVKRFVYVSSSMVYGDFEDQVLEDSECNPRGQYGILKLAGEWLVKDYASKTNMEYVIIRPSAVYGPLDVEDRVIAKFMLAAMRGNVLRVDGANETLDFTYIDDVADGIVASACRVRAAGRIYNITKSHSVPLLTAAEVIVQIAGKGSIDVTDRDTNFPRRGSLCIDRAKTILGYNPKVEIEEGFQKYYEWLSSSTYWQNKLK